MLSIIVMVGISTCHGSENITDYISKLGATLHEVFKAASTPNLKATHLVAAWNTLCALIDQCLTSESETVRKSIWDQNIWHRSFELYLDQSHQARPKSSKQLLSTLSSALRKLDNTAEIRLSIGRLLIEGVSNDDKPHRSKACLQALAQFLGKDVLSLSADLACMHGSSRTARYEESRRATQDLLSMLFKYTGRGDFGSVVAQVFSAVLDKSSADIASSDKKPLPLWAEPLESAFSSHSVKADDLRSHILPVLFKRSLADYIAFLQAHGFHRLVSTSRPCVLKDDDLLFAALETGKELGLLYETDEAAISHTPSSILIPLRCIDILLCHASRSARLTGLSLLITSHAATRPLPARTFQLLKRRLALFFADTDANFRGEVFTMMQRLMDRARAITAVLTRQASNNSTAVSSLQAHKAFLKWLLRFLSWELRPTSSYQRHISALKTLLIVIRSALDDAVPMEFVSKSALAETKWSFHLSIMDSGLRRLILDLLLDPFDDVRQTSATILSMYATTYNQEDQQTVERELKKTIDRAEANMLATGRADQADGVAHLHALLFQYSGGSVAVSGPARSPRQWTLIHLVESIENVLNVAGWNLASAATRYPVHGLLTSLRYVITQSGCQYDFDNLPSRLAGCLHKVWQTVKPILCNDAPEGYMPDNSEEISDVSTKDTLSYCWRALKESSLLLGTLMSQKTLTNDMMLDLSNLCFTQLAELRHRGAFSTVAQTWITCCTRCCNLKTADGEWVLNGWQGQVLDILSKKTTINTRRSAGLPSLICGLLIADKTGLPVSRTVDELAAIARLPVNAENAQEASLPQVHALNCIKDVLKNSRLAESSEACIPKALLLAAESLRSKAWAIRNCGLMLFRAVIDRLLGTSESHMDDDTPSPRKISLQQHPELLDVVLDLLGSSNASAIGLNAGGSEGVFPALQLVQRIQIPEERQFEVRNAVFSLTASTSWHVRDKAARAYAAIINVNLVDQEIQQLLVTKRNSHNALHGDLLSVKYLIVKFNQSSPCGTRANLSTGDLSADSTKRRPLTWLNAVAQASQLYLDNYCAVTTAAFVDIVTESLQYLWRFNLSRSDIYDTDQQAGLNILHQLNAPRKLELVLSTERRGAGQAALRYSLARVVAYEILTKEDETNKSIHNYLSLILELARSDADACSVMFTEVCRLKPVRTAWSISALTVLIQASSNIFEGCYDLKLKCEIQRFLLHLVDDSLIGRESKTISQTFVSTCASASSPFDNNSNQLYSDQWLQLQAAAFEFRINLTAVYNQSLHDEVMEFVYSCNLAIQQRSDALYTREAAALAISRIRALWSYLFALDTHHCCDLCFAVYDLLNDDDEDIRFLASETVGRMRGSRTQMTYKSATLETSTASQRLLQFMSARWLRGRYFAKQAFRRAFGISASGCLSVADQLVTFLAVDTALFAEEKQNLYIDDAREVRVWSQVILALDPPSIPRSLVNRLTLWVSKGLDELTTAVGSNVDGPLGWSSKPDVFRLGLQVFYGAEVLLHIAESGVKLPVWPLALPPALRLKLYKFSVVARERNVNPLWIRELDRVLTTAVVRKVRHCGRLWSSIASTDK